MCIVRRQYIKHVAQNTSYSWDGAGENNTCQVCRSVAAGCFPPLSQQCVWPQRSARMKRTKAKSGLKDYHLYTSNRAKASSIKLQLVFSSGCCADNRCRTNRLSTEREEGAGAKVNSVANPLKMHLFHKN